MPLITKAYLGATPLFRNEDWFEDGAFNIVNTSSAVTVTADATAHTKGAWAQLVASTSSNASLLVFYIDNVGGIGVNTAMLIDIGTGASGSETAIVSNIGIGAAAATAGTLGIIFGFPFKVPSGTRLSARIQAVIGGDTARVIANVIDAGDYATAPTSVDSIGGDTATSQGTSFSGASGTWVEGIASTTQAYRGVVLTISSHTDTADSIGGQFEIGVGASGSEVSFGANFFQVDTNERAHTRPPYSYLFGRSIPAGSRLAVKHPIASNPSKCGFNLIGIP